MRPYVRIAIAASVHLVAACSSLPESRMAQTEVGRYSYLVAGQGAPALVFESGLGTSKETWHWIFSDLARTTTVFAYDRAEIRKLIGQVRSAR